MSEVLDIIGNLGVIPVIKIQQLAHAEPLAEALLEAGLPCVEITFRTDQAGASIRSISTRYPEMMVGAGTVLTVDQARAAVDSGARFIVAPGTSPAVVEWCLDKEIPITPGIATPSEISLAKSYGLDVLKFFPAEALGGSRYLKAIAAAAPGVRFIPTGGVSQANLAEYIELPYVFACGGSWIASSRALEQGDFTGIRQRATEALAIIRQTRGGQSN